MAPPSHRALASTLTRLSADEMVSALGAGGAPRLVKQGLAVPFFALSRKLGRTLAELDIAVDRVGLPAAAAQALKRFGVIEQPSGDTVTGGPCLVLANHPGAYDALALMSAIARSDLRILAADRTFLRALPRLSQHLLFVSDTPAARAGALKRALAWLRRGGALLHFPAGQIEPDADFAAQPELRAWHPGASALAHATLRAGGKIYLAGVRGVHSPRAKRSRVNRWAEQRGVTTLSPLLQMLGGLRDVTTRVHRLHVSDEEVGARGDAAACETALRLRLLSAIARA